MRRQIQQSFDHGLCATETVSLICEGMCTRLIANNGCDAVNEALGPSRQLIGTSEETVKSSGPQYLREIDVPPSIGSQCDLFTLWIC